LKEDAQEAAGTVDSDKIANTYQPRVQTSPHVLEDFDCAFNPTKPVDGIIAYLTGKHGGNVHDKGIVTMNSKAISTDPKYALRNVANLTSGTWLSSVDKPNEWVC
jgi:hypothetical protein